MRRVDATLSQYEFSSAEWGDFDKDGDLDVVGIPSYGNTTVARVFRNDGAFGFYEMNVSLPGLSQNSDVKWADLDNDNDLDLILTGCTYSCYETDFHTYLYENRGPEGFQQRAISLPGSRKISIADFSGDGKLDIAVVSYDYKLQLWMSMGAFSYAKILTLDGMNEVAWTDFDQDGRLDFGYGRFLYRNNGDLTFQQIDFGFVNNGSSDYLFADFDLDGDTDFFRHSYSFLYDYNSGHVTSSHYVRMFENTGNLVFSDRGGFPSMQAFTQPISGDFDDDGDIDIVLSGLHTYPDSSNTMIFWNKGNWNFKGVPLDANKAKSYVIRVTDLDADNDLDVLGFGFYGRPTSLFVNQHEPGIIRPAAPATQHAIGPTEVALSWDQVPGMNYNLSLQRDSYFIYSPQAALATGKPYLAQYANLRQQGGLEIARGSIPEGYYRWSVQTLNRGGVTSPFSEEREFTIYAVDLPHAPGPLTLSSTSAGDVSITWQDNASDETMYAIERSLIGGNSGFSEIATGSPNTTAFVDELVESNTIYYYRIRYQGPSGVAYSNVIRAKTLPELVPSPTNLQGIAANSSSVELTWDYAGGSHQGFLVQRASHPEAPFSTVDSVDFGARQYADKTANQLANLSYRVVAFADDRWSDFSNIVTVTVPIHQFDTLTIQSLRFNHGSEGLVWADVDGDGDDDLFLAYQSKLFRNDGGAVFSEVLNTGIPILPSGAYGTVAVWGDYDNDGWIDLFIGSTTQKVICRNLGGTSFEQMKTDLTFDKADLTGAAWVDIDSDGDLDLTLGGNYQRYYYRYDGKKTIFTRVDFPAAPPNFRSLQSFAWSDLDGNGFPDAFLGNYGEDEILMNQDGETFERVTNSQATEDTNFSCCPISTPFAAWSDFDNDKDLDLTVTHRSFADFIYKNNNGHLDSLLSFGSESSDYTASAYWADYDNDGDLDVLHKSYSGRKFYNNEGSGQLALVNGHPINLGVSSAPAQSLTDIDDDGFLDFVTVSATVKSYRSVPNENAWLKVRLKGRISNSQGLGSTVYLKANGTWQRRDVVTGHGYFTQQGFLLHFGLGSVSVVDSLVVRWSSGARQYLANVPGNQKIEIDEADAQEKPFPKPSNLWSAIITSTSIRLNWQDNSEDEDGFVILVSPNGVVYTQLQTTASNATSANIQGLTVGSTYYFKVQARKGADLSGFTNSCKTTLFIFTQQTALGITTINENTSGASWCDFDKDGLPDLLLSGQNYSGDVLYRNLGGEFPITGISMNTPGIRSLTRSGSWGDFDNDGYSDLFFAAGGNYLSSDEYMHNKLFRNLGNGSFAQILTGSIVQDGSGDHVGALGDFNNDSFLDIWLSNDVRLLRFDNTNGTSFSQNANINSQVKQLVASDIDSDGDLDLIGRPETFATPLSVFINTNGTFASVQGRLPVQSSGSGFVIEDLDEDGDFDILVAGEGPKLFLYDRQSNTYILKANVFPGAGNDLMGCFAGDYDNNGHLDVILTRTSGQHDIFLNSGSLQFARHNDVFAGWVGLNSVGAADYNADGALDLVMMASFNEKRYLVRNNLTESHWLRIKLRGVVSNRDGIGAKVKLFVGTARQLREIRSGNGQYSFDEQVAHFGLGSNTSVDYVKVEWPSGIHQWIANPLIDALMEVTEEESPPPPLEPPTDLTATLTDDGLVNLSWTDQSDNEVGFQIEKALGENTFTNFRTTVTGVVNYTDSTFAPVPTNAMVNYRVRTLWFDQVVSEPSNVATVHVVVNGLEDNNSSVTGFPNPASEVFHISSPSEIGEVQIHSVTGAELRSYSKVQSKTIALPVQSLPPGAYVVTVTCTTETTRIRLIIRR